MSNIAIITARGGSKRIPRKNIKDFCGRPIIAYSIEAALKSELFDEVMVSTDDEEIAEIARKNGASVPFMRDAATSNDFASTCEVCLEVLKKYKSLGKKFNLLGCIYPTAPFVTSKKLIEAVNILKKSAAYEVVPVVRFSFPPQRAYVIDDGKLSYKWEEFRMSRSQDLEPFYHDAGQFYIYNVEQFLIGNGVIRENIAPIIMNESEVQDIDNYEDWKIAEMKYKMLLQG